MTSTDAEFSRLLASARVWAGQDPDPATAAALTDLLGQAEDGDAAARYELADSFRGTLQFGTAGLRAALGPGPNRMNRVVVRRAAAGFTAFLTEAVGQASPGTRPRAVVGYDARYNSDIFAEETAAILTAAGVETFLMPSALPTPLLAYAVRALECDGGVMVTASHNPPQDNGYKVYLGRHAVEESGRGAQIVAPYDARIAAKIDAVGTPGLDRRWPLTAGPSWTPPSRKTTRPPWPASPCPAHFPARDLKIVLTPMHGVGGETVVSVLNAAGFADVTLVSEQAEPDPDFPTVNFPNPEEPGALDLALKLRRRRGRGHRHRERPRRRPGRRGGQGPGHRRLAHAPRRRGRSPARCPHRRAVWPPPVKDASGVFANSIVSSRLLARIAAAAGYAHEETLTGFKWIARVPGLRYGYEEALGYCVAPDLVRDKDGISAAVLIAELAAAAKADGKTVFDTLDELYLRARAARE